MKKLAFVICMLSLFTSCSTNSSNEETSGSLVKDFDPITNVNQTTISNISHKDYKIEKDESNDVLIKLFVYIPDTSKLKSINKFLMKEYNSDKKKWYNAFYFNKKGIVEKYLKSLDDKSISDKEWERKYSKYSEFCNVNFNPNSDEESFDYNK